MNEGGIVTLTVKILGAVSEFSRRAGDLVRDIIVGFGSIISSVSYMISARAPISTVMEVVSGVIERLAPVMASGLVSFIAVGETLSEGVASFASSAFGPLGKTIGTLLGYIVVVVTKFIIEVASSVAASASSTEGNDGRSATQQPKI